MNFIYNDNSEIIMSNILNQIIIFYTYINKMIFNLFKSKPSLKELIPEGFVDIHSHILPGIDDGAKDVDESLILISKMKKLGFSKIIGTPHSYPALYDNDSDSIKNAYKKIKNDNIKDIELEYASEYMLEKSLIKKAKEKKLLCLKDSHVLVEMSYISEPTGLHEIIFELIINNYKPVIAHPERYPFYFNNFEKYYKLKKIGCLFQLNLLSSVGYYGKQVMKVADKMLKRDLIDYVGSDIHNHRHVKGFERNVYLSNINVLEKVIESNSYFR